MSILIALLAFKVKGIELVAFIGSVIGGAMSTSTLLVEKRALTVGMSSWEVARWRQVCPLQGRWLGSAL